MRDSSAYVQHELHHSQLATFFCMTSVSHFPRCSAEAEHKGGSSRLGQTPGALSWVQTVSLPTQVMAPQ